MAKEIDRSVLKLYIEEIYDPNKSGTTKRDYQRQNIEKYHLQKMGSQNVASPISSVNGIEYTVADIFNYVKAHDSSFTPKSASKVVDEDGKPLVVYHGTDSKFTVFDRTKTRANNVYIDVNEIKSVYGKKTYTNLLRIIKAKMLLQK